MALAAASLRRKDAVSLAKTAVGKDPENARWHDVLGMAHLRTGRARAGLASFQRAVELEPTDPDYRVNLGACFMEMGQWKEARSHMETAISWQPQNGQAHHNMSIILERLGDKEGSDRHLAHALKESPEDAETRTLLGQNHLSAGRVDQAGHAFRGALRLDPTYLPAKTGLVMVTRRRSPIFGLYCWFTLMAQRLPPRFRLIVTFAPLFAFRGARSVVRVMDGNLLWLAAAAVLYMAFVLYLWTSGTILNKLIQRGSLDVR